EIDDAGPEIPTEDENGNGLHLAGLNQCQHFKKLVERAEAAGEHRQRAGAHGEVHLAQRKIMELEAQLRRHIRIGALLVWQHDVEPDRLRTDIRRTAIRRLHDRWTTARTDDEMMATFGIGRELRGNARELARLVIIF